MANAGWIVIVEIVGNIIKMAMDKWGNPTEEIKKKLLEQVTLPVPGEADAALSEINENIPPGE